MTASVRTLDREEVLAAQLRDAVEEFEDSSQGVNARLRFCVQVLKVADRLAPAVRLVASPIPAEGARRLLADLEALPGYIRNGNDDQSRRVR